MSGQHAIVHRLIPGGANVNLADEVTWDFLLINTYTVSRMWDQEEQGMTLTFPYRKSEQKRRRDKSICVHWNDFWIEQIRVMNILMMNAWYSGTP